MPTPLSRPEFVALMAMLAATVALSIDAMLPALPQIATELSPEAINRAQLVITSFVLGMGLGTFVTGPLSDRFGRKPVMLCGSAVFILGALGAAWAQSLEMLLVARAVQGLGAAGPRVVAMAVIRDLYAGRSMAQITSFVMIVFSLVPAVAPLLGAVVIDIWNWRAVFYGFVAFSAISALWLALRLPETIHPAHRRPLRFAAMLSAVAEMFAHPVVRLSIVVQSLCFGMLFGLLSSVQQVFDITFGRAETFPLWFGAVAVISASSGVLNARLVTRLGMIFLVRSMLLAQVGFSAIMIVISGAAALGYVPGGIYFAAFLFWQTSLFFQAGMTIGNLYAIAQEPMGHIAGLAASVISSVATVGGVLLAVPVGLMFDGTALPLSIMVFLQAALGVGLMYVMEEMQARYPTESVS